MEALPEDVVRVVLSHVASPWVVQARAVSKQWRRILCCTQFAMQWAATARHATTSTTQSLCLLLSDPANQSAISALHLPTLLCIPLPLPLPASRCAVIPDPQQLFPLASSPLGLLLFAPSPSPSSQLSLFHPLSRLSLSLPPLRLIHTPLFAAVAPSSSSRFHILALGIPNNPSSPIMAEMYSSATSSWTPLPCLPSLRNNNAIPIPRSTASLVWWREAFCMLWGNRILTLKAASTCGLQAEAASLNIWSSSIVELPREPRIWDARFLTLHVIKDRLFVEGNFQEQGDFQRRYPLRIAVVEFDSRKRLWKEASFMPDSLSTRLCIKQQHPAHSFYTAYSDSLSDHHIYFTPFFHPQLQLQETDPIEVVLFDVDSCSWSSISKVPASAALFSSPSFKGLTLHASC